jgi:CBS domain-containing protein
LIRQENNIHASRTARVAGKRNEELGDFTTTLRVIPISLLAMCIGVLGSPQLLQWQLQRLLPVADADGLLTGVLTSGDLHNWREAGDESQSSRLIGELARLQSVNAYPDEPLRVVVNRMAENGITRMPVIDGETQRLVGLVTLEDLLKARTRHVEEERHREQVIQLPFSSSRKEFRPRYDF